MNDALTAVFRLARTRAAVTSDIASPRFEKCLFIFASSADQNVSPSLASFALEPLQITVPACLLPHQSVQYRFLSHDRVVRRSSESRSTSSFFQSSVARAMPQNVRAVSQSIRKKSTLALFERSSLREPEIREHALQSRLWHTLHFILPFPERQFAASCESARRASSRLRRSRGLDGTQAGQR